MSQTKKTTNDYHPLAFFLLVLGLTWAPWLITIAIGKGYDTVLAKVLLFIGVLGPTLSALLLVYLSKNTGLRRDYWQRVIDVRLITPKGYAFILLMVPAVVTAAVLISTFFGRDLTQFLPVAEVLSILIIPFAFFTFLAGPLPEEMGWRGYWLDSLRTRYTGLTASIIIGCTWAMWHVPLFFVPDYPLQEKTGDSLLMIVYFIDLIPKAVIYTYVFYSNNRSTLAAILFHFMGNFVGTLIEIDPLTEIIQLILLMIVAVVLVGKHKQIYFHKWSFSERKVYDKSRIERSTL